MDENHEHISEITIVGQQSWLLSVNLDRKDSQTKIGGPRKIENYQPLPQLMNFFTL